MPMVRAFVLAKGRLLLDWYFESQCIKCGRIVEYFGYDVGGKKQGVIFIFLAFKVKF